MKKSRKRLLIVSLVGAALVCSFVVILSESGYVFSVAEESSTGNVVTGPATLPPLTSHEEAVNLADGFLKETFGDEFFQNRFTFVRVDERPDLSDTWFIVYDYFSNGYTVEMKVAVNAGRIPEDRPRIDVDFSEIILQPLEVLISEEEAKRIAQEKGLEPPYIMTLFCRRAFNRIYWKIVRDNAENLNLGELVGVVIDAETGEVLDAWRKSR
jgi:hypothetical protein